MKRLTPQQNYTVKPNSFTSDTIEVSDVAKVKILMVDDRQENLLALEAVLMSENYDLVSANSGEEALKRILKEDYAVILLDVQMPGLNGFETAKIIKSREKTRHIPIIFITAINKATEHVLHGYSVGAIDYIFKPFHPETLKLKVEEFVKIYQNQQKIKLQSELLRKEVNERNKMAEQLEKSNSQIASILESIADAFYAVDKDWRFTYVNQEAERQMGRSRVGLIGKSLWDVYTQPSTRIYHEFHKAVKQRVSVHFETIWLDSDRWYDVRAYPSENGLSVYLSDITKRKRMEQDLHLSQERFRKIFESSPCLIAIRSLKEERYIDVNANWLYYTGYSYEEVKTQISEGLCLKVDSPEGKLVTSIRELGESLRNARITYLTKSGDTREGLLSTEIIEVLGERCILCVVTDITERVILEKEMARLDRLNLIGEMAAGIAHEIRNPMTTISGFLQISKNKQGYLSLDHINLMMEELNRANTIITEFLNLAKNKTTDKKLKDLNYIIKALFPLIEVEAILSDKHVDLELGECLMLYLDEKEIRQLILNITLNGLEAMSSGGRLTIKTYTDHQAVVLEIQDQGSGIKEEFIEKMGTPFFTTKEFGTGLGLAVCYSIAERHNAMIDVETDDQGTVFFIRFRVE